MPNKKITELPAATLPVTSGVKFEAVQGGVNVQVDAADLPIGSGAVAAVDVSFSPTGTLSSTDVQSALQELDADILAAVAGLKWKSAVRVATVGDGNIATAFENGDTVDGVVLATGNRILLKNQTDQTANGIYTVNASGDPSRSTDTDSAAELEGAAVTVLEGTTNANTTWLQITDNLTLGVSNIVWGQFGSSVPDADGTTKGIAKLYNNVSGTNTDGPADQNSVKAALDAKQATLTASTFGDFLVALTGKTTPVDADVITLADSAASDDAKKVSLTNLKAFLKTYFDTLYPNGIPVVSTTGTAISFAIPQDYGSAASPETGNVTLVTTGLVKGMVQVLYHDNSSEPTFGSEFVRLSGFYITNTLNIIRLVAVSTSRIEYGIFQEL